MKTKLTKIIVVAVTGLACSSCGTMYGLGQDFQKVGRSVQSTAQGGLWRAPAYQAPAYRAPAYTAPTAYAPPR